MSVNLKNLFHGFFKRVLPFALSFSDDALLLVLDKLGVHLPGLQLSTVLLSYTLVCWAVHLYSQYHERGLALVLTPYRDLTILQRNM